MTIFFHFLLPIVDFFSALRASKNLKNKTEREKCILYTKFWQAHNTTPNCDVFKSKYLPVDLSCTYFQLHGHRDHGLLNLRFKTTLRRHSGVPGSDKVPDDFPHCVADLLVQEMLILHRRWDLKFSNDKIIGN